MAHRIIAAQLFVFLLIMAPIETALGQSFNCTTARLQAEKTICSGRLLSKLDEQLDQIYGRLQATLADRNERRRLSRSQRNWLRARNQCKSNRRCLREHYRDRLSELEGQLGRHEFHLARQHPGPSFDCQGVRLAAELAICRSRHVSNLDRRMDEVYRDALRKSRSNADRRNLQLDQLAWVKGRNACRFDRACLRRSYNNRIGYLTGIVQDLVSRPTIKPAFNCRYARLASEKAICASRRLAEFDVEADRLYKLAQSEAPSAIMREDLKANEKAWLNERNRCGADRECIAISYSNHLIYLENILYYFRSVPKQTHRGPSFDCGPVKKLSERMICDRKNLSRLDRQLARTYESLQKEIPRGARTGLKSEQVAWLKTRDRCGADAPCLRRNYKGRIADLEAQLDEIRGRDWKRNVKVSPSFNCKYARLPAEVTVCDNSVLAQLDREMASAYFALRDNTPKAWQRTRLKTEQRKWLAQRNRCGYRVNCLRDRYEARLYQLERALDG